MRNKHARATPAVNIPNPPGRKLRGQQQIRIPRTQSSHQCGKQRKGAGKQNGRHPFFFPENTVQPPGNNARLLCQPGIGQLFPTTNSRNTLRIIKNRLFKDLIQIFFFQIFFRIIKGIENLFPFLPAKHGQAAQGPVGIMQGLHKDIHQTFMEPGNLLSRKKLGQIIVIHTILLMAFHIAQMDAQLLRLAAAVVPPSGKYHRSIPALIYLAVLVRESN